MKQARPNRILLVTGMSGAGKSTALKTLEDVGWEVVDNLPFVLLDRLLATRDTEGTTGTRPLALGIDSRTRGFAAQAIVDRIKAMRDDHGENIATLFLDCTGAELERRYSETRRRHPLAPDRPASDGIARERELIAPLRRWADHVIDTTASTTNDLKSDLRSRFEVDARGEPVLTIMSFGFARGLPRNADLVFDMRFLRNPYWDEKLRELTGKDEAVGLYIRADPAYSEVVTRMEELLLVLLPRYRAEGKAYVTIAFGCTGGRHRSVHIAERVAERLRDAGFSPTMIHRDLGALADHAGESRAVEQT
ncbi:MAG: RNase adapter RapZ [Pseudomonadota bacterium]|jgi:RNase adapter protein RapZ